MTPMTAAEHDHLLIMIETMQRAGHPEHAIHDAVRRSTRGPGPERRKRIRLERLRSIGRRRRGRDTARGW
jgi:hypothetical protein